MFVNKIKEYILANQLLDEAKLKAVLNKIEKDKLGLEEVLVDEKYFSASDFNDIKSKVFNIPAVNLIEVEVTAADLNLLAPKVADNYQAIIFARAGNRIKVGLVNPGNFLAHEALEFLAKENGWQIDYYVVAVNDFKPLFKQYTDYKKELTGVLESAEQKFAIKDARISPRGFDGRIKSAPVAKIVSVIIGHALEGGASDIHFEPGLNESRVRYRVDGVLHTSLSLPIYLHNTIVSRIKVMANLRLDENRIPQDGHISSLVDNQRLDLRVSVLPMLNSEKVVIKVSDTTSGIPTLEALGFSPWQLDTIERHIEKPFGLVLLTGPTGSGKTTTLYSILNRLKSDAANITTLEDPIEYYIDGINQSQINTEAGFTFADGLRAILRQDPNVVMVGEIRDNETAELSVHASLAGQLVFSTLYTNSAWGAISRLIEMKAEPFLLAATLNLVLAQRLVRQVCPDCRHEETLAPALLDKIKQEISEIPDEYKDRSSRALKFYRGRGCSACNNTGYTGRTVISEVLEIGQDLRTLISQQDFNSRAVKAQLKKQKYVTLRQHGILKALAGLTSIDEIMRVTQT